MHSKNIILQHGHIYDAETKKRILVKEGIPYILFLQSSDNVEDGEFKKLEGRENSKVITAIKKKKGLTHYKKIADKDSYLYFYLLEKDENNTKDVKKARFRIKLLEDLYLYACKDWSPKLAKDGKLFDCACVVDESKDNELPFFENIYANSIASVYKRTHVHYFGNEGSPSQNTFDSIYFQNNGCEFLLEIKRGFDKKDRYIKP